MYGNPYVKKVLFSNSNSTLEDRDNQLTGETIDLNMREGTGRKEEMIEGIGKIEETEEMNGEMTEGSVIEEMNGEMTEGDVIGGTGETSGEMIEGKTDGMTGVIERTSTEEEEVDSGVKGEEVMITVTMVMEVQVATARAVN